MFFIFFIIIIVIIIFFFFLYKQIWLSASALSETLESPRVQYIFYKNVSFALMIWLSRINFVIHKIGLARK